MSARTAARPVRTRIQAQSGMTVLEILVAVGILASLSAILYGAFRQTLKTQTEVKESQQRWHVLRVGMARMTRELGMAYISLNENLMVVQRRTYFMSKRETDVDELTFSTFAHRRTVRDAKESDQCLIRYYGARDPDDRSKLNLMRRETRRLGEEEFDDLVGESYILIENIVSLHYEFYDPVMDEWKEEWDTTSLDGQPNRLPPRIRIYLAVLDEKNEQLTLLTEARVTLTDALNFTPATATTGYGTTGSTSHQYGGLRSSRRTSGTPMTTPYGRGTTFGRGTTGVK